MNLVRICKDSPRLSQLEMPILSRLQSLRRPRGVKSRLGFSRWGFPEWKTIDLKEEVLGVLAPSEIDPEDRVRQDDLSIDLAVIRREEFEILCEPSSDPAHELQYAVLKAASEGRWEDINQVYNRPGQEAVVLHAQNKFGWGPLHFAVHSGHLAVVKQLVSVVKLPLKQKTKSGHTPLMLAAAEGHLPVARLLVETYHCDVNEEDGDSATPVMFAARKGNLPVVTMFLEHGGDVFPKAKGSVTALHLAAYGGSLECVEYLLSLFGDRRFEVDESGWTCLHWAVVGGSLPVMRYLVDQCGFDLSLRTEGDVDCFLLACWKGHQDIVRELLTKDKVDQNVVDKDGNGAVHLACGGGHTQLVQTLVKEFGMSPEIRDNDGYTPLMFAAVEGHLPVARLLVETYHCDVNEEDGKSMTSVMYAAVLGHLPVLRLLMEHGGDVFYKAKGSRTALHLAAYGGSLECVEYLLPLFGDRKFEVDEVGGTCLHCAVVGCSIPVMRYLVDQCGFDLSLRTANGRDCFLVACVAGHQEIVRELLTKDKVDQNVVDEYGRGAVHLALENGHAELVQTLVNEFGMSLEIRDNAGRTPFQPTYTSHESVLENVCWIPFGIESLFITPFGGVFPLVHERGKEEGDEAVIQLHVPQGAVRAEGEGMMEVRYAVILDGPFKTPEGYSLCSPAVYIHYNPAQTTKPFHLLLPHWSGAPDHPTFVTSPHTLPEGEQYYPFRLLEGGEFGEGYGILEVDGHSTLFGEAYQLEDTSRYYASLWEREEGTILHSKVAITFESNDWMRFLKNHWTGWRKRFTGSFEMKEDHIESSLNECKGRGWSASVVGKNWVGPRDIEYMKKYKSSEKELQYAVEEHLYPPAISLEVVQSKVPRHLQLHKRILLHVHGAKEGVMNFPIDVLEEKEANSVVAAHQLSSESGSTERPASLKHQTPTIGGEMEVARGRSEADVSDRDRVLSQPVHLCERYAVLFRKHVSRNAVGKGRAILEWVGLAPQVIDQCYGSPTLDEEAAVQKGLHKWRETDGDRCTWQVLLGAMEFSGIAQQHCSELVEELHQRMQGN